MADRTTKNPTRRHLLRKLLAASTAVYAAPVIATLGAAPADASPWGRDAAEGIGRNGRGRGLGHGEDKPGEGKGRGKSQGKGIDKGKGHGGGEPQESGDGSGGEAQESGDGSGGEPQESSSGTPN